MPKFKLNKVIDDCRMACRFLSIFSLCWGLLSGQAIADDVSLTDGLPLRVDLVGDTVTLTPNGEVLGLQCKNQSFSLEYFPGQRVFTDVFENRRIIFVPTGIGYGGVNVFYKYQAIHPLRPVKPRLPRWP